MTSFTGYWLTQGTTSRARVVFPMGAEPPRPSLNPGGDYSGEKSSKVSFAHRRQIRAQAASLVFNLLRI